MKYLLKTGFPIAINLMICSCSQESEIDFFMGGVSVNYKSKTIIT